MCSFFKCIFACLLPPVAVLMEKGCNCDFCLNLFLTLLLYFPGCIHAYCVICREEPQYIQGVPQVTIINNTTRQPPIMIQPLQHAVNFPHNYPQTAGQVTYPSSSQHYPNQAPPAYDNPSAPNANEFNFKTKFDD